MSDNSKLYNSRMSKNYLDYLGKYHPDVSIDSVLDYAGMIRYEVEDPAHWFNQKQMDDFHEILVQKTGDLNISRAAGRYTASGGGFGAGGALTPGGRLAGGGLFMNHTLFERFVDNGLRRFQFSQGVFF